MDDTRDQGRDATIIPFHGLHFRLVQLYDEHRPEEALEAATDFWKAQGLTGKALARKVLEEADAAIAAVERLHKMLDAYEARKNETPPTLGE